MVETLDALKDQEALAVLAQAFRDHPVLPPNTPPQTSKALLELMIRTFACGDSCRLHGIRKDGSLACVAFSLDAQAEPGGTAILLFFFRMCRILGLRTALEFVKALAKRAKHKDRYLELLLLGTKPAYHGQGLGRMMLNFLYGFAGEQGYRGVVLDVAKETPAYRFYVSEGFVVDRESTMNNMPMCSMRRDDG